MSAEILLACGSVLISMVSLAVSFLRGNALKEEAKAKAKSALGEKYAQLGWAYSKAQPDSSDSEKARKHAIEGFIIADTAFDGKRDFTDRQVAFFVDGAGH